MSNVKVMWVRADGLGALKHKRWDLTEAPELLDD
jgi:hypothetical protein